VNWLRGEAKRLREAGKTSPPADIGSCGSTVPCDGSGSYEDPQLAEVINRILVRSRWIAIKRRCGYGLPGGGVGDQQGRMDGPLHRVLTPAGPPFIGGRYFPREDAKRAARFELGAAQPWWSLGTRPRGSALESARTSLVAAIESTELCRPRGPSPHGDRGPKNGGFGAVEVRSPSRSPWAQPKFWSDSRD